MKLLRKMSLDKVTNLRMLFANRQIKYNVAYTNPILPPAS